MMHARILPVMKRKIESKSIPGLQKLTTC